MSTGRITRPFADGDYGFDLAWPQLIELEAALGSGLLSVLETMVNHRTGRAYTNREVIRLALIGGGAEPKKALTLVQSYVEARPVMENFDLVAEILEAALFGSPEYQAQRRAEAKKTAAKKPRAKRG